MNAVVPSLNVVVLSLLAACGSSPKLGGTSQASAAAPPMEHAGACPFAVVSPFDHELFPGCAPAPFTQPFSVCRHGDCPKPCKIQSNEAEAMQVTYDHGVFATAKHTNRQDDELKDVACTYDGGRLKTCEHEFFGTLTSTRDANGLLTQLVESPTADQPRTFTYDANHRVATYAEYHESFDVTYGEGDRVAKLDWHYKGKDSTETYAYNSDGDIVSTTDGDGDKTVYEYGPNKLITHVVTGAGPGNKPVDTKLEYDDKDRLIRETESDPARGPRSVFVTSYTYCE